ncbi:GPW/gp25 family protein [Sphingosinicella sp. CPCC 101087]|uniref:GPW/gp25 family protein n=1 Tax=Sphingosinicella sp. CPCC 101087 TaxID=2497754 RepID=UPI00101D7F83|nr:GPW/gp25 family protein [Sphingosinicella sp. CPCC 101087]
MIGMNAATGAPLEGNAHLAQSIADILTTPIGSRCMRRDYGSLLFALIDQPINATTRQRFIAATATALSRWEKRIRVAKCDVTLGDGTGAVVVDLEAERIDAPAPNSLVRLTVPLNFGRPAFA